MDICYNVVERTALPEFVMDVNKIWKFVVSFVVFFGVISNFVT